MRRAFILISRKTYTRFSARRNYLFEYLFTLPQANLILLICTYISEAIFITFLTLCIKLFCFLIFSGCDFIIP